MRALALLTGYAFLFGMALGALYDFLLCVAALFLPGGASHPIPWERLPRRAARFRPRRSTPVGRRLFLLLRFFGDVGFFLIAAAAFAVFLYCFHDGIPRLFILVSAGGGFFLFCRYPGATVRRAFNFLLLWGRFALLYFLSVAFLPVLDLSLCIFCKILSLFRVVFLLLKNHCVIILMKFKRRKYMRREIALLQPSVIYEKIPR